MAFSDEIHGTTSYFIGPFSYETAVERLTRLISDTKEFNSSEQAMTVAIEGLSNSGKSTLASNLEDKLDQGTYVHISIEGDAFHVGKETAMKVYNKTIADAQQGIPPPADFINYIWRFPMMQKQVLDAVTSFNRSELSETTLHLTDILTGKKDGSEHDEEYPLTRDSIVVVNSMFLAHLSFDYVVRLDVSAETSVQRKIERDQKISYKRDPAITRGMVELIEEPIMVRHCKDNPIKRGITIDINDFGGISWKVYG